MSGSFSAPRSTKVRLLLLTWIHDAPARGARAARRAAAAPQARRRGAAARRARAKEVSSDSEDPKGTCRPTRDATRPTALTDRRNPRYGQTSAPHEPGRPPTAPTKPQPPGPCKIHARIGTLARALQVL